MKNKNKIEKAANSVFFSKKTIFTMLTYSLILPLVLKVFIDTPTGIADYICNSYENVYPTATGVGLIATQILTVLADFLRAGFIGAVLCTLLFGIGKKMGRKHLISCFAVVLLSPLLVSAVGIGLNYLCVSVGFSREPMYLFRAQLPQLIFECLLEYFLYAVLLVGAVLVLYSVNAKHQNALFADSEGFFPVAYLYRVITVAIGAFGVISLAMTVFDMILDLQIYGENITESISGVMGYLVLPYLYLIFKLFAMLIFSAVQFRRLNRLWKEAEGMEK